MDRSPPSHYTCARCGERCCADDDGWVEMFGCLCLLCLKELETSPSAAARRAPAAARAARPAQRSLGRPTEREEPRKRRRA